MNLTECPCLPPNIETTTEHPLEIELKNASLLYQLRRRATHSRDAFEASLYIFGLTGLVVISVLLSKMWRTKNHVGPNIYYPQNGPKAEILVKDMLKKRAKSLAQYFGKKKPRKSSKSDDVDSSTYLRMDTFFNSSIDSNHTRFLQSESEDDDSVLIWDKKKGDWVGYESSDDDEANQDQSVEYHFQAPENTFSEESDYDSDSPLIHV